MKSLIDWLRFTCRVLVTLVGVTWPIEALADSRPVLTTTSTSQGQFHPHVLDVDNAPGVWLPKDEMARLVEAASKYHQLTDLVVSQDRAIALSQLTVATSSAATAQYKFAAQQSLSMLEQCKAALTSESERCESVWRQPILPLGLGVVAGALMCIGTARAER